MRFVMMDSAVETTTMTMGEGCDPRQRGHQCPTPRRIRFVNRNEYVKLIVSLGIKPGYIVFPSHKKQCIYLVRRTAICMEHEKISSSAPGLA